MKAFQWTVFALCIAMVTYGTYVRHEADGLLTGLVWFSFGVLFVTILDPYRPHGGVVQSPPRWGPEDDARINNMRRRP